MSVPLCLLNTLLNIYIFSILYIKKNIKATFFRKFYKFIILNKLIYPTIVTNYNVFLTEFFNSDKNTPQEILESLVEYVIKLIISFKWHRFYSPSIAK